MIAIAFVWFTIAGPYMISGSTEAFMALRANPEVLQLEAIQRWNGQMPQFLGGSSTPFIQILTNPNR